MLRAIYAPFGVTWLTGLDCFENISTNYCLISRGSLFMQPIQKLQDCALELIRVRIITDKMNEIKDYGMTRKSWLEVLQKHYSEEIKKFMSPSTQCFDVDVAFPCDIDLQWYLVPKTWIRMQFTNALVTKLRNMVDALLVTALTKETQVVKLEIACRKAIGQLTATAGDLKVV